MLYELNGIRPQVADDAWIADSAEVMGNIRLQAASSVWFTAVLRGDNELIDIGEGSNVQDGCVLHTDFGFPLTIGKDVTIGHKAILHGCTIEDGALIGMGAIVLNGAVIGENAVVGAGALVPEGKEIPAGSLAVGNPARVVRELTDEQKGKLKLSAVIYQKNRERFQATLKRIDGRGDL